MGHKVLTDHANVFCQMFVGWRMTDDFVTLASLPDGVLTIDVLAGTCQHNHVGQVDMHIAREISAWFLDRLNKHHIPRAHIVTADLTVNMAKHPIESKRQRGVTFDWACQSRIQVVDRSYTGELYETHTWFG